MRIRSLSLIFLLFLSNFARAEWIPVEVTLDELVIGQAPMDVSLDTGTSNSVRASSLAEVLAPYLEQTKIRHLQSLVRDASDVLIVSDLEKVGIKAYFDEKELRLKLDIPLDQRLIKDFSLNGYREKTGLAIEDKPYSGYLNYSVQTSYSTQDSTGFGSREQYGPIQGQLELIQNLNFLTLESTATYREQEQQSFQRQNSSLVYNEETRQIRYRFGDFDTGAQGFQAALPAAGVQMQKQFNIRPDLGSLTKRSALIQVKQSSIMEVYVNGTMISRIRVNPGPYNLRELPVLYGRNLVQVVMLDDFGGREEFTVDLMFDDQILSEGVHDFSYQAGVPSYYTNFDKRYDEHVFSSVYHRYGVTNAFTFQAGLQSYQDAQQYQIGGGLITSLGTHFLDVAYFRDDSADAGRAWRWRYSSPDIHNNVVSHLRVFGGVENRSANFKSIQYPNAILPYYSDKYDFVIQKQLGNTSSLSFALTELKGQNTGVNESTRRLGFQTYFSREWMGDISYEWSNQRRDQILMTLTWNEVLGYSSAAMAYNSAVRESSLRYNHNNSRQYQDTRLGLLAAQRSPTDSLSIESFDLDAEYFGRVIEPNVRLNHTRIGDERSFTGQVGLRSAVAWTQESIGFSRPISDSFAIVAARGLGKSQLTVPDTQGDEGIPLKDGQKIVYTNLTSYIESQLQIDSTELPVGFYLEREAYVMKPSYRSGIFVPVQVVRSVLVKGRLKANQPELVNYAYGKIWTSDGRVFSDSFFTDESGNFILDGISYGSYEIELSDPRLERIPLIIQIPDSSDTESAGDLDLGDITVEKKAGT